eukprot:CAMPEP_0114337852 /NCGR_PEP_ID=MMETSP0101-20121206/6643_1 /TAXON_ID=38822 ORGANISM="Pteridomonas danica, Strain PT" /NCGR_SAMPLE_ID=MMETSP0101 /ASSEMBLY_ACC=CAM_ASM_000211 /LENGTH=683 /DNA_ID=CAMNT_0001470233 /DNA_START=338 /DNA_END=2387 /DNA_ORIENTATION=-
MLQTKTSTSFWEVPTCKIWVQDLITNYEWIIIKTVDEIKELAKQVQSIEDAAIDDEEAELALNAAINAAISQQQDDSNNSEENIQSQKKNKKKKGKRRSSHPSTFLSDLLNDKGDDDNDDDVDDDENRNKNKKKKGKRRSSHPSTFLSDLLNDKGDDDNDDDVDDDENRNKNKKKKGKRRSSHPSTFLSDLLNDKDDEDDNEDNEQDDEMAALRRLNSTEERESKWKLEDDDNSADSNDRKGALFQYLLSHGGSNTKHLIQKKLPTLINNDNHGDDDENDVIINENDMSDQEDKAKNITTVEGEEERRGDSLIPMIKNMNQDKDTDKDTGVISMEDPEDVYYEDSSLIGDILKHHNSSSTSQSSSSSTSSLSSQVSSLSSQRDSNNSMNHNPTLGVGVGQASSSSSAVWNALQSSNDKTLQEETLQEEDIFKFLRRIIQISLLFDPNAKELNINKLSSASSSSSLSSLTSSEVTSLESEHVKINDNSDEQALAKGVSTEVNASQRNLSKSQYEKLIKKLKEYVHVAYMWAEQQGYYSQNGFRHLTSIENEVSFEKVSSLARAVRSSLTSSTSTSTSTSKASTSYHSHNKLVAEIRAYTMGILSLPPLARLLSGYVDMMVTELDDMSAEFALSSVVGHGSVGGNETSNGVASSVRSVGKMFSSFLSSVITNDNSPPPPPPPPPS